MASPRGGSFFPNGGHENTLRLAYSDSPPGRIAEGIRRLGEAYRELAGTGQMAGLCVREPAAV